MKFPRIYYIERVNYSLSGDEIQKDRTTFVTDAELITGCKRQDRKAQQDLYERFSPKMFSICKRYLKNQEDAEDVLVEGFFKVFDNISKFKGKGSFEGWIRRIIVNQCLMQIRKAHNFKLTVEINNIELPNERNAQDKLQELDILNLLNDLPTGYRTVFNLYVIEGYKHREIAEMLGISINTSKSQLILAKERMRKLLKQHQYPEVG
ncbi:MAG: RNA polymerase sigma factor [Bacteroidota bacterium]